MIINSMRRRGKTKPAMSPIRLDNVVDQEGVENDYGDHRYEHNKHTIDKQMVDVDEIVIAAELGHGHEDVLLAEHVHAHVSALHELRHRVDAGEHEQRTYHTERSFARAVHATEVRVTHVQVPVHCER